MFKEIKASDIKENICDLLKQLGACYSRQQR